LGPLMAMMMLMHTISPASAAAVGVGVVTGRVAVSPCIPAATADPIRTLYTFTGTTIVGAIVTSGGRTAVGTIAVLATGRSAEENQLSSDGTVTITRLATLRRVLGLVAFLAEPALENQTN